MCRISYIYHSGFFVELDKAYLMFDYYKGDVPAYRHDKKLFVFASHHHPDHFNPEIFRIFPDCAVCGGQYGTEYILGYDIKLRKRDGTLRYENVTAEQADRAHIMRFDEKLTLPCGAAEDDSIDIYTVKSTDCGVAYLIFAGEKVIYHAGDLNDWCREEMDKAHNNNMTAMYMQRLERIKELLAGRTVDYAFLPLDPRQGRYYDKGMNEFIREIAVSNIYPMHMWEQYEYIEKYKRDNEFNAEKVKRPDI